MRLLFAHYHSHFWNWPHWFAIANDWSALEMHQNWKQSIENMIEKCNSWRNKCQTSKNCKIAHTTIQWMYHHSTANWSKKAENQRISESISSAKSENSTLITYVCMVCTGNPHWVRVRWDNKRWYSLPPMLPTIHTNQSHIWLPIIWLLAGISLRFQSIFHRIHHGNLEKQKKMSCIFQNNNHNGKREEGQGLRANV